MFDNSLIIINILSDGICFISLSRTLMVLRGEMRGQDGECINTDLLLKPLVATS